MAKIKLPELTCLQCGHKWTPRTSDVRVCPNPKCHSYNWDKPRKRENKEDDKMKANFDEMFPVAQDFHTGKWGWRRIRP